jgi:hypothetical protein
MLGMWKTVTMEGNQKIFLFSLNWVNIGLCSVLQFSYPLLLKFFNLHLPSFGADYFDNVSSLALLLRAL